MRKIIEDNILKIIGISPFIIIGIGTLILNLYLSKFHIADFNFFQTKTFLTGASFLLFLIFVLMVIFLGMNMKDISENSFLRIILNSIFKPILLTNVVFIFLQSNESNDIYQYYFFSIPKIFIQAICIQPIFLAFIFLYSWPLKHANGQKYIPEWHIMVIFAIVTILTNVFASLVLYKNDPIYQQIFSYIFFISLSVFSYMLTGWGVGRDREKNIDTSFISKFTNKREKTLLDLLLVLGLLLFGFIGLTFMYAKDIYPYFPDYLGGGKVEKTIVVDKEGTQFLGEIILKNTNGLFIKTSEEEIIVLKYDDIFKIRRDTTSNSIKVGTLIQTTDSLIIIKK